MAEVIRMPLLSDTMTEGKIVKWNKQVGDKVKSDDVLADVETDKATMDVVGYANGTLLYVGVKEGEAAKVNEIIAIIGREGEDISGLLDKTPAPGAAAAPTPAPAATTPAATISARRHNSCCHHHARAAGCHHHPHAPPLRHHDGRKDHPME